MGYSSLKKFFSDDGIHTIAGTVVIPPGEDKHYFVNDENNLVVHVETHHHSVPVVANLSNGPGVWTVPDVGAEVILACDMGNFEGELYVIGHYGYTNVQSASAPAALSPQQHNVFVTGDINLIVGSGATIRLASSISSGEALALQSELHAIWRYVKNQFDSATGHTHTTTTPGNPTGPLVESSVPGVTSTVPEPSGTQIVKGE